MFLMQIAYLTLCMLIMVVWVLLNRRLALRPMEARAHWLEATGSVVRLSRSHPESTYSPTVRFTIEGKPITGIPTFLSAAGSSLSVGDEVDVLYDPDEPTEFLLKDFAVIEYRPGLLFFVGTFFLVSLLASHYKRVF